MSDENVDGSSSGPGVALCLSGGGLRATLFHLGVIKALRYYQFSGTMALLQVRDIYSVSGGSILAAHLLRNFDRYTGTDDQYAAAECELLQFARSNVRDRVLRRWGLTAYARSRRYWLAKEYQRLLGQTTISEAYASSVCAPKLHILATNFNTGELCSFTGGSFEKVRRTPQGHEIDVTPAGILPLAYAVAASSSFPPMFPPVPLTPEMLGHPDGDQFNTQIDLSDGGVYDNFGIEKFRMSTAPKPGLLIVSHAGGSFDTAPNKTYASMLARNIRASDIMMRRVGDGTLQAAAASPGQNYAMIRIGATVDDGTLETVTQQQFRLVRTDLDSFGRDLGRLLVDHGYRVGCSVLKAANASKVEPAEAREAQFASVVRKAAHRSFWPLVLDFRDWTFLVIWWLVGITLLSAAAFIGFTAYQARQAEAALAGARERTLADQRQLITGFAGQLESLRQATATGNIEAIKRALAGEINVTEQLSTKPTPAAQPASPQGGDSRPISPAEAERIVDERPTVPSFAVTRYPQQVIIQFAGTLTRAQITALNAGLKKAGWRAQGSSGERIASAANLNEVRYSGPNRAAAVDLAAAINSAGLNLTRPVVARENPSIQADVLEAWISR